MIPCLTVRQPWASAFFEQTAPKDVENRTWSTEHRGLLAIHAGMALDDAGLAMLGHRYDRRDFGVVLGTVELTGCHRAGSTACDDFGCDGNPWAFHPLDGQRLIHWTVEHPRRFVTPVRAKGRLQLWTPPPTTGYLIETAEVEL